MLGRAKTRLARDLGKEDALFTYTTMLQDLINNLSGVRNILTCYVDRYQIGSRLPIMCRRLLRVQRGENLGERMKNAFKEVFCVQQDSVESTTVERAVLIGSDIPQLTTTILKDYLEKLRSTPVVIGPAADGGYYLIGFQRVHFNPAIFDGISWSTEEVFAQTVRKLEIAELKYCCGPLMRDIDTLEDLHAVVDKYCHLLPCLCSFLKQRFKS